METNEEEGTSWRIFHQRWRVQELSPVIQCPRVSGELLDEGGVEEETRRAGRDSNQR